MRRERKSVEATGLSLDAAANSGRGPRNRLDLIVFQHAVSLPVPYLVLDIIERVRVQERGRDTRHILRETRHRIRCQAC
jgi:hypothetical protein